VYTYKPSCPAIMRPPDSPRRRGSRCAAPFHRYTLLDPCFPARCRPSDRGDLTKPSTGVEGIGVLRAAAARTLSLDGRDSSIEWSRRSKSASKHSQGTRTGCAATSALGKADPDSAYSLRRASPPGGEPSEVAKALRRWRLLLVSVVDRRFQRIQHRP
jgi:hypothetical protein